MRCGQGVDDLFGVAAGDGGLDARVLFEKRAEHAREDVLRDGHRCADAERAGGFAAQAGEGGAGFFRQARPFAGVAEKEGAGVGESDAAFAAVEESGADFFFEGLDLLADGGLAEVESFGGTAEAGFFGNGAEDLQPKILHRTTVARTRKVEAFGGRLICRIEPSFFDDFSSGRSQTPHQDRQRPQNRSGPPVDMLSPWQQGFCAAAWWGWCGIACSRTTSATSDAADAFRAAFRIPNILQNLFGEGVLSASFIPVYARLRAEEKHEEASQLAEAVFALLVLVTAVLAAGRRAGDAVAD